ncbi:MAG: 2-C-methyl-D-erythritol 4-phosphate cytidylyltransferase [Fastidiosipilaceae bacterium]|jgi:2-C-methyl-D-erythritol 4-phosphate cytidylyltransferase|nr:2-C-methyl-D-erythritol 4-phosphate cytidylyltransferase [Clostridiaceae bacterium]
MTDQNNHTSNPLQIGTKSDTKQSVTTQKSRRICALIPAAGRGQRMGADGNKLFLKIDGKTILERTIAVFETHPSITDICLVTAPDEEAFVKNLMLQNNFKKTHYFAYGGATRGQSVKNGLQLLATEGQYKPDDLVLIHDGARCFVTPAVIDRCIDGALIHGSAVAGIPAKDTIKSVDANECVTGTPDRSTLRLIQTPQAFHFDIVCRAYADNLTEFTDDAAVVEANGQPVYIVLGSEDNLKITTPFDLAIASALLQGNQST